MTQADQDYEKWLEFHKSQLDTIQFPELLRRKLWQKLSFEEFDISSSAKIIIDEEEDRTDLMCTKNLAKESEVFLIDHAWTFRYQDALKTLSENIHLCDRLSKIVDPISKRDIPKP